MMNFVLKRRNVALKTRNFVFDMMNFAGGSLSPSPPLGKNDELCINSEKLCITRRNCSFKMMLMKFALKGRWTTGG